MYSSEQREEFVAIALRDDLSERDRFVLLHHWARRNNLLVSDLNGALILNTPLNVNRIYSRPATSA